MKRTFFTAAILFCSLLTLAQETKWDSTYRPNMYGGKVGQFRFFKNSHKDIVFLGNSITSYGNWEELLNNKHAKNRGIPGDLTFGVLDRLDEVTEGKPSKVFILIGTNDIARNIPDSIILRNYTRIIQRIKRESPRTKIYFQTLLPVNNTFQPALSHFNKDAHFIYVNNELKKLGQKEGIIVIDLYSAFLDGEGRLIKELAYDGLHLNDKGYFKWIEILKNRNYLE